MRLLLILIPTALFAQCVTHVGGTVCGIGTACESSGKIGKCANIAASGQSAECVCLTPQTPPSVQVPLTPSVACADGYELDNTLGYFGIHFDGNNCNGGWVWYGGIGIEGNNGNPENSPDFTQQAVLTAVSGTIGFTFPSEAFLNPNTPGYYDGIVPSVNYLTYNWGESYLQNLLPYHSVQVSANLITTGSPTFIYQFDPDNDGGGDPPHLVFILCETGWDDGNSPNNQAETSRFFSDVTPQVLQGASGPFTYTVSLTDLTQWIDIYGQSASSEPAAFQATISNLQSLVLGFGGGNFAAHGLAVQSGTGTASLVISSVSFQ